MPRWMGPFCGLGRTTGTPPAWAAGVLLAPLASGTCPWVGEGLLLAPRLRSSKQVSPRRQTTSCPAGRGDANHSRPAGAVVLRHGSDPLSPWGEGWGEG